MSFEANAIFAKNLSALRAINPQAADMIAAASIPDSWIAAIGTDGTATYQQRISDSQVEWLGHTSMPQSSAEPLISSMSIGETNGMGTPFGTGWEWKLFADRLPSRLMVFVYEPDPIQARMVLHICDLAEHISALKIVPLIGQEALSQLRAVLQANVGIEPPTVIHPLISYGNEVRYPLISASETIIRAMLQEHQHTVSSDVAQLLQKQWPNPETSMPTSTLDTPANAVSIIASNDVNLPLASRIKHINISYIFINKHHSADVRARLTLLQRQPASCIESDLFRSQLGVPIPEKIPVRTWVSPLAAANFWEPNILTPTGMQANDRVIVHSSAHADWLKAAGFQDSQIALVRLPFTQPHESTTKRSGAQRVAIAENFYPLDPEAYKIGLPTHVAIWQAVRKLIEEDPLGVHEGMTADLLRRAEQRSGVRLTDALLIHAMQRAIRHILLPGCVAAGLMRMLKDAGLMLDLIGNGWQNAGISANDQIRIRPALERTDDFWRDVAAIIHAHPAGIVSPTLLHAAECGVTIIAPPHPRDSQPLALHSYLNDYPRPQKNQLINAIKRVLSRSIGTE